MRKWSFLGWIERVQEGAVSRVWKSNPSSFFRVRFFFAEAMGLSSCGYLEEVGIVGLP